MTRPLRHDKPRVRLDAWVWRALFRSAIAPLLVVEAVLIIVYLLAVNYANERNIETTRTIAVNELGRIALREAALVSRRLESVSRVTDIFSRSVKAALQSSTPAPPQEVARYTTDRHGTWHTRHDPNDAAAGRCSVYFSGITSIAAKEREKAWALAAVDPEMNRILAAVPLVSQVYFNSHDSMNRICPPFDVLAQYAPRMDIPAYSFYYLADATHNPARRPVWTDAYVDPAGQGWMASSIAPVYEGDFLEGVVGLDVTLESLAGEVLDLDLPWGGYGVLIARDGTIIAMPEAAERDFGLKELKAHHYASAIQTDTFKPDAYNVFKRSDLAPLGAAIRSGERVTTLPLDAPRMVSWSPIDGPGWFLAVVVPESNIYAQSSALDDDLRTVGFWMIGGVALFYAAFLLLVLWRSRHLAASIAEPLASMNDAVEQLGHGRFRFDRGRHEVIELDQTLEGLAGLGETLEYAAARIEGTTEELERNASLLQAVIDAVPAPVFFTDAGGGVEGANRAYRSLAARLADGRLEALVARVSTSTGEASHETMLWRSDAGDGARDYLVQFARLPSLQTGTLPGNGEVDACVGVLVDVTVQEQARALAEEARDTALAASRLKSEFLASVSHEIRTPMNGIIGMVELLDDPSLSAEQRDYVGVIRESAEALLVIINDILDFARLESGAISVRIDTFDPVQLVCGVIDVLAPRAAAKGLALGYEVTGPIDGEARSDAGRLRQVLLNLVGNALKFTSAGSVKVVIGAVDRADGKTLRFEVVDSGPGIARHLQSRLFIPFSQLDGSNTREHGGTGLGLSISKRLVEALGGRIGCISEAGKGATFWFEVPVGAAPRTQPRTADAARPT